MLAWLLPSGAYGVQHMADAEPEHMYDERFEFDAPRFYDFEAMTGDTPADKWFETAPEGPGRKPERKSSML